eukprot:COSAG06_NODE_886_length_11771_cov_13.431203_13_plen_674_part_00
MEQLRGALRDAVAAGRSLYGLPCRDIPSLFDIIDTGGTDDASGNDSPDGSISKAELQIAMERLGLGLQPKQLEVLLSSVDVDENALISRAEFFQWLGYDEAAREELLAVASEHEARAAEGEAASLREQLDVAKSAVSADDSAAAQRVSELESNLKTAEEAHAAAVAATETAQRESQDAVAFMEAEAEAEAATAQRALEATAAQRAKAEAEEMFLSQLATEERELHARLLAGGVDPQEERRISKRLAELRDPAAAAKLEEEKVLAQASAVAEGALAVTREKATALQEQLERAAREREEQRGADSAPSEEETALQRAVEAAEQDQRRAEEAARSARHRATSDRRADAGKRAKAASRAKLRDGIFSQADVVRKKRHVAAFFPCACPRPALEFNVFIWFLKNPPPQKKIITLFFLQDGSGSLQMREVRALLRSNGIVRNPSVEEALAKYDTDGDGEISRAEFDGLYKHLRSMQAAAAAKAEAAGAAGGDDAEAEAEAAAEAKRAHFAQVKEKTVKQQQELERKREASRAKKQASTEATQATTAATAAESVESLRDLWKESEAEMEALQWELKQAEQLARQQVLREKGAKRRLRARRTMTGAVQAFVQNPAYRRYGSRARALVPQCLKRAEFSGAENVLFAPTFTQNRIVVKTGLGQTKGKDERKMFLCRGRSVRAAL